MAYGLFDTFSGVAKWGGVVNNDEQRVYALVNGVERYNHDWAGNEQETIYHVGFSINGLPGMGVEVEVGSGLAYEQITHHNDFHYRFWVVPSSYTLRDPDLGAPFTFDVWNTFPTPALNELQAIVYNDISGVDLSVAVGYDIRAFELAELFFSVNEDAPAAMAGSITFEFEQGDFSLGLIIERDTTLPLPPDYPWTETLRWETNVLTAEDSTEQRISLAATPEVTHSVSFTAIDNTETITMIGALLTTARNAPSVPFYQFLTALRADTLVGDTIIETKTQRGDLRAGDSIVIRNRQAISEPAKIESIAGDLVTLTGPLQNAFKAGSYVIPAYELTVDRTQPIARDRVESSKLTFTGRPRRRRYPFLSAQNTVSLRTLGGLPVLDRRPLGAEQQNWIFDSGRRFAEYGRTTFNKDPWKVSFIDIPVNFLVDSFFTPLDWAFWRTFLDYCRGAQKPFLLPTFRQDLIPVVMPTEGAALIEVKGNDLTQTYMETGQLKGLRIVTNAGEHYCTITSTAVVDETKETINFDPPLPTGSEWAIVKEINMIFLVRMKTDEVQILHYPQHATVSFAVRTIKA